MKFLSFISRCFPDQPLILLVYTCIAGYLAMTGYLIFLALMIIANIKYTVEAYGEKVKK